MVQLCATMQVSENPNSAIEAAASATAISDDAPAPPPPPPPPTPSLHRRPRVREVSSRFMSPAVSTVQRRRQQQQQLEADPSTAATDENHRPLENSETPFPFGNSISQCKPNLSTTNNQRKQRAAAKLFKENNNGVGRVENLPHPSKSCSGRIGIGVHNGFAATPAGASSRPDTPTITVSSRYRLSQQQRSAAMSGNASAATKLLQASGMSLSTRPSSSTVNNNQHKGNGGISSSLAQLEASSVNEDTSSVYSDDECRHSSISCSIQSLPELCSEGNMLPTVSARPVAEKIGSRGAMSSSSGNSSGDLKFHTPLSRSISLPSSSGSDSLRVHSIKGTEKQAYSTLSKQCGNQSNHVKVGGLCLPPVPPCAKPVMDTKKGKKGSSHQEDVHFLKLLYNRHLQWRFANAKAEVTMRAQLSECEKALHSHAMTISELRDSVNMKRLELGFLQRRQTLSAILEAQIPYLDEWSALEEDYSVSITEAAQALSNASVQLPIGGNVRADVREVGETLNASLNMMETIVCNIQRFMPKAQETDISVSELARVVGGERALIGECGDLLSKTYKSQVEECSLRGQLIQLNSIFHKDKNTEQKVTHNSIASP